MDNKRVAGELIKIASELGGRYAARNSYQALQEEREKLMIEMSGNASLLETYTDPAYFTPQKVMEKAKAIYDIANRIGKITAMFDKAGGLVNKVIEVFSPEGVLQWRSPKVSAKEAAELLNTIGDYNNFSGAKVASYVKSWQGLKWEVGREYSPVLYAYGIKDVYEAEDVASTLKRLKAQEISLYFGTSQVWNIDEGVRALPESGYKKATMRIWWD